MCNYLVPVILKLVNLLHQRWILKTEQVWSDADDRAVTLVQVREYEMRVETQNLVEPPQIRQS